MSFTLLKRPLPAEGTVQFSLERPKVTINLAVYAPAGGQPTPVSPTFDTSVGPVKFSLAPGTSKYVVANYTGTASGSIGIGQSVTVAQGNTVTFSLATSFGAHSADKGTSDVDLPGVAQLLCEYQGTA